MFIYKSLLFKTEGLKNTMFDLQYTVETQNLNIHISDMNVYNQNNLFPN